VYEKNVFDPWLDPEVKQDLLNQLQNRWDTETNNACVFISATERQNIDLLRQTILDKVKELYALRYPYLTKFY
jgi:GTPase